MSIGWYIKIMVIWLHQQITKQRYQGRILLWRKKIAARTLVAAMAAKYSANNPYTIAMVDAKAFWNDYLLPSLVLGKKDLYTIPIATQVFYGTFSTDMRLVMVALLLAMLPILILYVFLQRYIVVGVTAGAVK